MNVSSWFAIHVCMVTLEEMVGLGDKNKSLATWQIDGTFHLCVGGRWLVEGSLSASPRASDGYGRCGGSSFPTTSGRRRRSIGQKPSRLRCRCQHRWRLRESRPSLEALCWDASYFGWCPPGGNISLSLRRSDDGGIGAVSFLRASLWRSWTFAACGALTSWAFGVWSANNLEA
jgi:hypothetical protein